MYIAFIQTLKGIYAHEGRKFVKTIYRLVHSKTFKRFRGDFFFCFYDYLNTYLFVISFKIAGNS